MLALLHGHRSSKRNGAGHTERRLMVNAGLVQPDEAAELYTDALGERLRLAARISGRPAWQLPRRAGLSSEISHCGPSIRE
jgi:hypothetical protein